MHLLIEGADGGGEGAGEEKVAVPLPAQFQ